MAERIFNEDNINYGVDGITTIGDLNLVEGAAHDDIPLVIKVDGQTVKTIGASGLVLNDEGAQDHFEINCTS